MGKIIGYLTNMLPYMLAALPIILLVRLPFLRRILRRDEKINLYHEAGLLVWLLLLVGIASQTAIPKLQFGDTGGQLLVNGDLAGTVNLIPGAVFLDLWQECIQGGRWMYFAVNVVGNLCLFFPVGFFPPLLWKVSLRRCAGIALGMSFCIELAQLFQFRGTDIDDLWLNLLGALAGYGVFRLLERRLGRLFSRFRNIPV